MCVIQNMPLLSKKETFLWTCVAVKISGLKIPPRIVWFLQPFDKDRTHKQSMDDVWQGHPRTAISVHVTLLHVLQSLCRRAWPGSGSSFVFHCKELYHASKKNNRFVIFEWLQYSFNRSQSHSQPYQFKPQITLTISLNGLLSVFHISHEGGLLLLQWIWKHKPSLSSGADRVSGKLTHQK